MSTNSNAPAAAQGTTGHPWTGRLAAALKRWWVDYLTWRLERVAIDQFWPMTDRYLKDIGLTRSEITTAVKGDATRDRGSHRARTRTMDDDDGSEPRGEHAPLPTRVVSERLIEILPQSRLKIVAGAGHMGPLSHAADVSQIVRHIADAEVDAQPRGGTRGAQTRPLGPKAQAVDVVPCIALEPI